MTFLLVNERAPKNDWAVFCRSTDGLVRCPSGGPHAAGPSLVLQACLVCRVHLPGGVQQVVDFGFHLCHAPGDGLLVAVLVERVRQFETQPAEPQEQLARGVGLVPGVEQDLHDVAQGRDVPELGVDTRLGGRLGQDGLWFFFLGAGEFRRVLVPRTPGQDRAHPRGLPFGQSFLHGPLRPFNHFSDDAGTDSFGGVQNRFGLHPDEHVTSGTFLPSDQDGGFLGVTSTCEAYSQHDRTRTRQRETPL